MDDFKEGMPTNYLMYFDINSLYAYAMSQALPIGRYEWEEVTDDIIDKILNTDENSTCGYMLEVDIDYPKELHSKHNDYPFLCERQKIGKTEKLILNLNDKTNYVLHYLTLRMAIDQGLKLKRVHKILKFEQSKWLKPFIDFNTYKRMNATNDFEKKLYKLFSNSVYGKTIENVRKYRNVRLYNEWEGRYGAKVAVANPNFKRVVIFNENLVAIESFKDEVKLNKPIAVGACVLEISKIRMYDFHYNFMLDHYNNEQCKIAYTDTDSFIYNLKDKDIYNIIKENTCHFDTSDYPVDNTFGIGQHNKKMYGIMKDENVGKIMTHFIGLRAKLYLLKLQGGYVWKRAKGVKKCILKRQIDYDDYYKCLFDEKCVTVKQNTIKSVKHRLYSVSCMKKALDPFDDKRFILDDKINTLAWGHCELQNKENE